MHDPLPYDIPSISQLNTFFALSAFLLSYCEMYVGSPAQLYGSR